MKSALVLIDLQKDFLGAEGLQPAAGAIVEAAAGLVRGFRERGVPVVHVWTTVRREPDNRMPHWRAAGIWKCEEGTAGHAAAKMLMPVEGERVFHKQFFGVFGGTELEEFLQGMGVEGVVLAGVHLHACVRTVALEAYERGFGVCIAEEAVGSDDVMHAAITRRYLGARGMGFESCEEILLSSTLGS